MEPAAAGPAHDPARALIARLPPELREAVLHRAFALHLPEDRALTERERWGLLACRGVGGSTALPQATLCVFSATAAGPPSPALPRPGPPRRVQWLLLFKALGAARTPAQLGLQVSFVATEAKGRSQAEHMRQFAALLSERRDTLARLSVTAGEQYDGWGWELESALHGTLDAVRGSPIATLHLALRGRGVPFMGEALQGLPALLQLSYDSRACRRSSAPLAGSMAHLVELRELIVEGGDSYRIDALPASIRHITNNIVAAGSSDCLGHILGGLPAHAQLLSLNTPWTGSAFDNMPALESLTSLTLHGVEERWPGDFLHTLVLQDGLQCLSCLKKLSLEDLQLSGGALQLMEIPALEVGPQGHSPHLLLPAQTCRNMLLCLQLAWLASRFTPQLD